MRRWWSCSLLALFLVTTNAIWAESAAADRGSALPGFSKIEETIVSGAEQLARIALVACGICFIVAALQIARGNSHGWMMLAMAIIGAVLILQRQNVMSAFQ